MSDKPQTARSYKGAVVDDNAIISINLKWLAQGAVLIGGLVYGYYRVESRIQALENQVATADEQIGDLLDKHIVAERAEREELADQVAWYEKILSKKKK